MRLFFYYAFHSFVNTIRKVLKTWVAFFLACLLLGVVIGLGVGVLVPESDKDKDKDKTEVTAVVGEDGETVESGVDADAAVKKDKTPNFLKERGKTTNDMVGLIISAVFFLTLAMNISNAKSSGKIFKPADVTMLFATPMKPQSVLMFRLIGTLAMSLCLSIYMLFQLPNLIPDHRLRPDPDLRNSRAGFVLYPDEQNEARHIGTVHICDHRVRCTGRCFWIICGSHRKRYADGCI